MPLVSIVAGGVVFTNLFPTAQAFFSLHLDLLVMTDCSFRFIMICDAHRASDLLTYRRMLTYLLGTIGASALYGFLCSRMKYDMKYDIVVFLVTDSRVFNEPLGRSLRLFARTAHSAHFCSASLHYACSVTGSLTHFAHSLMRQLKNS